ncbi:HAD-IIIA family hydrolase [Thermosipho atlanticus]|uniref:D-glycero-D-manno-heptose 1,7-bisphosphate phosphatase n=1 Tax=Thermosipho atlanticus DSM 15807 TaxID=1123380 RepID=A0A1M5RM00_9BACT|nr:HAD-IIIA family hydrolase [Thermosipho atlanticus]SHH26893.1 D-glycero-D-manno-heptose 1,7-bisphosphate phosphatase [Thermosipho atlanticus DSM 15807]
MIKQAVILAGGLGTRLRSIVKDVPKPMAKIGKRPFLEYQIYLLKKVGITNILILIGYKGSIIKDYFKDGREFGISITYSEEKEPLGTGGAVISAWDKLEDEFLILNGDTFFDIEYDLLFDFVDEKSPEALIVLRYTKDLSRYGFVEIDDLYYVEKFIEKGTLPSNRVDGYINGGIYYFKKKTLEKYLNKFKRNNFISLEKEIFPDLVNSKKLFGIPMGGKFIDIGIPKDYEKAQNEIPNCIKQKRKPALFLDRDGVIIEDTGYPHGTNLNFIEKTFDLVKQANKEEKFAIVISNQAGVARGKFSEDEVIRTNNYIKEVYEEKGLKIDAFYYCPYHIDGIIPNYKKISLARKPEPGMILQASEDFRIRIKKSIMIGDKESDKIELWGLNSIIMSGKKLFK